MSFFCDLYMTEILRNSINFEHTETNVFSKWVRKIPGRPEGEIAMEAGSRHGTGPDGISLGQCSNIRAMWSSGRILFHCCFFLMAKKKTAGPALPPPLIPAELGEEVTLKERYV